MPPCLDDWPHCLMRETVVFGQFGRALFHRLRCCITDALPFSDDEMTPCHILLSPTRVRGEFTCLEIAPRDSSSAKTTRVSLVLFYNISHKFYVKSSAIGHSGTILVAE